MDVNQNGYLKISEGRLFKTNINTKNLHNIRIRNLRPHIPILSNLEPIYEIFQQKNLRR